MFLFTRFLKSGRSPGKSRLARASVRISRRSCDMPSSSASRCRDTSWPDDRLRAPRLRHVPEPLAALPAGPGHPSQRGTGLRTRKGSGSGTGTTSRRATTRAAAALSRYVMAHELAHFVYGRMKPEDTKEVGEHFRAGKPSGYSTTAEESFCESLAGGIDGLEGRHFELATALARANGQGTGIVPKENIPLNS